MSQGIINNYQDLKDVISDYLDRKDLAVQIPGFIQLCESGINRVLRHHDMICKGQTVGSRRDNFVPLPEDWLEGRNVELVLLVENPDDPPNLIDGDTFQLSYQSPDAIDMMKQQNIQWRPQANVPGNPATTVPGRKQQVHYTYYGRVLEIYPDPGTDFRVVMEYYGKVGPLSTQDNTNHLLTSDPDIYLYGALLHSAPFLRDDPRLLVWDKLYQTALNQLDAAGKTAMTSGSRLTRKVNVGLG